MGSKTGWFVAIGLVVVVFAAILLFVVFPSASRPTSATWRGGVLDVHKIAEPISAVADVEPAGSGNAGDDYAQAVELYNTNTEELEALTEDILAGREVVLSEVADQISTCVATGATKAKMKYVFDHTPKELYVAYEYPYANALADVGELLILVSQYRALHDQPDEAVETLRTVCVMGWHMYNERSLPFVMELGLFLQKSAADELYGQYLTMEQHEAAKAAKRYAEAVAASMQFMEVKQPIVWSAKPLKPGDVFNIVQNDADPAWRVQGLLGLGLVKWTARTRGDKNKTMKLISRHLNDADPLVKAAAQAAKNLTEAQFNVLGTRTPYEP